MWWLGELLELCIDVIDHLLFRERWEQKKSNDRWYKEHGYDENGRPISAAQHRSSLAEPSPEEKAPSAIRKFSGKCTALFCAIGEHVRSSSFLESEWRKFVARRNWYAEHGYDEHGRPIRKKDDIPPS